MKYSDALKAIAESGLENAQSTIKGLKDQKAEFESKYSEKEFFRFLKEKGFFGHKN